MRRIALGLVPLLLTATVACSSDDGASDGPAGEGAVDARGQTRLVGADEAADLLDDPPADLVVIDVRTPEEFEQARIEGATMIDIDQPDFANRIDQLDRDVPYFVYCRTDNRSGAATALMSELGFADVTELDGGIVAWADAGHPMVSG